jgi:hypothetical protein
MPSSYRFGDYQRELGASHKTVSMDRLFPKLVKDAQGNIIPHKRPPIKLKPFELLNEVIIRARSLQFDEIKPPKGVNNK